MKTMIVVFAVLAAASAQAGSESLIVIAEPGGRPVAATITRRADFVACPVSLSSEKKDPEERFADIQAATRMIASAAEQSPSIRIHAGPVSLSGDRQSSFSFSQLSSGYDAQSSASLHILVPIQDGKPDVFAGGLAIKRFLSSVKLPEKVRCDPGQIQLAVDNPEQYRADVLKAIAESIKQARELLDPNAAIDVTGLASPVLARQVDDKSVQLFINYSLAVSTARKQ